MNSPEELEISITGKSDVLVVTLGGVFKKKSIAEFEKCREQVIQSAASKVIFNCPNLLRVDIESAASLFQLQQGIRQKSGSIRFCSLRPDIEDFLLRRLAIKQNEIKADLTEAIKSF